LWWVGKEKRKEKAGVEDERKKVEVVEVVVVLCVEGRGKRQQVVCWVRCERRVEKKFNGNSLVARPTSPKARHGCLGEEGLNFLYVLAEIDPSIEMARCSAAYRTRCGEARAGDWNAFMYRASTTQHTHFQQMGSLGQRDQKEKIERRPNQQDHVVAPGSREAEEYDSGNASAGGSQSLFSLNSEYKWMRKVAWTLAV